MVAYIDTEIRRRAILTRYKLHCLLSTLFKNPSHNQVVTQVRVICTL